jgi:hypothetical protein
LPLLDKRSLDQLKTLGSGVPAPEHVASDFPTLTQALTIADALRSESDLRASALAVEIESACRAAL